MCSNRCDENQKQQITRKVLRSFYNFYFSWYIFAVNNDYIAFGTWHMHITHFSSLFRHCPLLNLPHSPSVAPLFFSKHPPCCFLLSIFCSDFYALCLSHKRNSTILKLVCLICFTKYMASRYIYFPKNNSCSSS